MCCRQNLIEIIRPDPRVALFAQIVPKIDPGMKDVYDQNPELYKQLNGLAAAAENEIIPVLESQIAMLYTQQKTAICNYNARLVAEYANREITSAEKRNMTGEFFEAVQRHSARKDRRELLQTAMQKDAHEMATKLCENAALSGPST